MKLNKMLKLGVSAVLAGAVIGATGCASTGPKVHAIYEQAADFSAYKTYSLLDEVDPESEKPYLSLTDKYLREAVRQELNARGLTEQAGGDLLIGIHVSTKEKVTSTTMPSRYGGYYGYRNRYGYAYGVGYGTETRVSQYTEGTLNIDVVDAAQKQVVWEGVAVGKLKEPKQDTLRSDIAKVVDEIFKKYPVAEKPELRFTPKYAN